MMSEFHLAASLAWCFECLLTVMIYLKLNRAIVDVTLAFPATKTALESYSYTHVGSIYFMHR